LPSVQHQQQQVVLYKSGTFSSPHTNQQGRRETRESVNHRRRSRMRSNYHDGGPWHLIPGQPGMEASFRRWNLIIILFLAFLIVGIFLASIGSEFGHVASAASKSPSENRQGSGPVNLVDSRLGRELPARRFSHLHAEQSLCWPSSAWEPPD
jgi:hypothetical protein